MDLTRSEKLRNWIGARLDTLPRDSFDPTLFSHLEVSIRNNEYLREPQRGAYAAASDYFARENGSRQPAIIQMPVGCGKSGTIAITPLRNAKGRALVVAPNLEIADTLKHTLDYTQSDSFWSKARVLHNGSGPTVASLDSSASLHDCDGANFLVANIQQLTAKKRAWLDAFSPDYFDMILVDEAHHSPARTWQAVLAKFPAAKVASFTATPLRADGKRLAGERIYRYPIEKAIRKGYIKDLAARRLEPSEVYFTYRGESRHHTLKEVLKLRETVWFSRGVALSRECNEHIVDASIQSMEQLRREGTRRHQIVAAACSIDHAKSIRSLYRERNLSADVIHSKMNHAEQAEVRARLNDGKLDAIVQVAMLGEGADYPTLSVAAIFRPYRHLVPYIQFIGRTMRALEQNAPGHPDNRAFVVSHAGLNVDRWWEQLRLLDEDDQHILAGLADGSREFDTSPSTTSRTRSYRPEAEVLQETLDSLVQQHYLGEPLSDHDRDILVDDLLRTIRLKGFNPDDMGLTREKLRLELVVPRENTVPFIPHPVQPSAARKQARTRLDERVRSAAKEVLNRLRLNVAGRDLIRHFPGRGINNLAIAIVLLNQSVNSRIGIDSDDRESASTDQLRDAHDSIDETVKSVTDELSSKLGRGRK